MTHRSPRDTEVILRLSTLVEQEKAKELHQVRSQSSYQRKTSSIGEFFYWQLSCSLLVLSFKISIFLDPYLGYISIVLYCCVNVDEVH